ncbi:SH2 domain-containing protein 2A isoform X2 [Rhinatrema bivittatum]|uniref:SH2 domain-containing protein 2A isoform X2 n=1 Tax=Rhinatrema bivittatum TaxID=194408 RepID=UPI001126BF5A|nr:SH2 domain-containing protein 2A isoform X2 [Rhinatrema bivittatum]
MDITPEHGQGKDLPLASSLNLLSESLKPNGIGEKMPSVPETESQPILSPPRHLSNDIGFAAKPETLAAASSCSPDNQSASRTGRLGFTPCWVSTGTPSLLSKQEEPVRGASPASSAAELPAAFSVQTEQWFQQTQAPGILQQGEPPDWFHGFITRREAEEKLQSKPLGCFLVRFCESRVGFVLSYRGTERCRHFVLDQLDDKRYVIMGEQSAHALLQDLLRHHHTVPIPPFNECLTTACCKSPARPAQAGLPLGAEEVPAVPPGSKDHPYALVQKQVKASARPGCFTYSAAQASNKSPSIAHQEVPAFIPRGPMNVRPGPDARDPSSTLLREGLPAQYPHFSKTVPADKYALLEKYHTYAEPSDGTAGDRRPHYQPQEPLIDFYAIGRGSTTAPLAENVYTEVDVRRQETAALPALDQARPSHSPPMPVPAARRALNGDSTLPPGSSMALPTRESSHGQNMLSNSPSKPTVGLQLLQAPPPQIRQLEVPVYARGAATLGHQRATPALSASPENIYERITECFPPRKPPLLKKH